MMTVAQLVAHLSSLPQDAYVLIADTSGLVQDPIRVRDAATWITVSTGDIRVERHVGADFFVEALNDAWLVLIGHP